MQRWHLRTPSIVMTEGRTVLLLTVVARSQPRLPGVAAEP